MFTPFFIFNISSQLGRVISPAGGHYSATKFALEALSEQLAYELAPHGVEVCIIQPGGYPTKVWVNRNAYSAALKARAEAMHTDGYPSQVAAMGTDATVIIGPWLPPKLARGLMKPELRMQNSKAGMSISTRTTCTAKSVESRST